MRKFLGLGFGEQKHSALKGDVRDRHCFLAPDSFVSTVVGHAGRQSKVARPHELGDFCPEYSIGIHQACKRAIQKTLPQAGQRPRSAVPECRRPVTVDVAGADGVIYQCLRFERGDDAPAQSTSIAGVSDAQVDDPETVIGFGVQQCQKAVAGPHFFAGIVLGFADFGVHFAAVGVVEFAAQQFFLNVAGYPSPGQQVGDAVPQFAARLFDAPHQRAGVKPG